MILPALDKTWECLINYFDKDIIIEDERSRTMSETYTGKIIGLTLDQVLIRRNNIITMWVPISHTKLKFYPKIK